jgi:hypothetical protein
VSLDAVAKKYKLSPDEARVEHALQLVVSQQGRATPGAGTWQTWDWLRQLLLDLAQPKHRKVTDEQLAVIMEKLEWVPWAEFSDDDKARFRAFVNEILEVAA